MRKTFFGLLVFVFIMMSLPCFASDYHILTQAADLKTAQVVFHFQVPASGTNSAGIQWQDAVKMNLFRKDEVGNPVPIFSVLPVYHVVNYPGGIDSAEETLIGDGEVIEEVVTVRFSTIDLTDQQRRDEIVAAHTARNTELINQLQKELAWIGYRGDVP